MTWGDEGCLPQTCTVAIGTMATILLLLLLLAAGSDLYRHVYMLYEILYRENSADASFRNPH